MAAKLSWGIIWLNDDIDRLHHVAPTGSGYSEGEKDDIDSTEAAKNNWKPDWQNNRIYAKRDLEDFARLWLSTQCLATAFQPKDNTDQAGADLYLGFQWSGDGRTGEPATKIYPAVEADGGTKYLGDRQTTPLSITSFVNPSGGRNLEYDPLQDVNKSSRINLSSSKP